MRKYGEKNFQQARNEWHRNARDCFLIELAKWGLGKKDIVPNINWFSKITADEHGKLSFVSGNSAAGDVLELRLELDTLVVLNTCQHPLDPSPVYQPRTVHLEILNGEAPSPDDPSLTIRPENLRAWENNEIYHHLRFPLP
jgi:uncharacterized protein YcgI (DUF1989 family)